MSLFVYYFIERTRTKEEWQQELLRASQLESENYKAQLQLLSDQLSPHFLFNSLNVLSSLIPRDPDKALHFTYKLSDLYRLYLRNTEKDLVTLEEEWEVIEAYLFLLETRLGALVQCTVAIEVNKKSVLVPPGSIQTLLENAVKHNASSKANPLQISIYTDSNYIYVVNPIKPRREHLISTQKGLQNLILRYSYLGGLVPIIEKENNEFKVALPLIHNNV
jgi:LytS/YehU family sensor histidine kinase